MIRLVDNRGNDSRMRLESVLNLANAYLRTVKLVIIIFDQGRSIKVTESVAEGGITQGVIEFEEKLAAQSIVASVIVDDAGCIQALQQRDVVPGRQ